jgi:hypothetical protein
MAPRRRLQRMGTSEPGETASERETVDAVVVDHRHSAPVQEARPMAVALRPVAQRLEQIAARPMIPSLEEIGAVGKLAEAVAQTEFVPQGFRGRPAAIAAAMYYGLELGFRPMTSLKYIQVIQGEPALKPKAMTALIRRAGHILRDIETTPTKCVLYGKRKDTGEEMTVTWTIEQARRAGLVRDGSGWVKYPEDMLWARATSVLGRRLFEDVILGSYTPEEMGGDTSLAEEEQVIDVESTPATGKGGDASSVQTTDASSASRSRAGTDAAGPSPERKPEAPAPPAPPPPTQKAPPSSPDRPSALQTARPALAVVETPEDLVAASDAAQANLLSIERTTASEMAVKIQRQWAALKYQGQTFPEDVIQAKARLSIQMWSDRTLGQRDPQDKIVKNSGPTLEQMTRPQVQQLIAAMTATLEDKK